jgi:hypothetical protein
MIKGRLIPWYIESLTEVVIAGTGRYDVYFIQCSGTDFVKIGFTKSGSVKSRMDHLQVGNPYELRLLGTVSGVSSQVEKEIHTHFHDYHHRGEWFRSDPVILEIISRLCRLNITEVRTLRELRQKKRDQGRVYAENHRRKQREAESSPECREAARAAVMGKAFPDNTSRGERI